MALFRCNNCGGDVPRASDRCPHCANNAPFPNIRDAEDPSEVNALDYRYNKAKQDAQTANCLQTVEQFESACTQSVAVIVKPLQETLRIASGDKQVVGTYYQQITGGLRIPDGDEWDALRRAADSLIFTGYADEIRFAAMSLDRLGLKNYGECHLVLKDAMIAHRASVLHQNSTVMFKDDGEQIRHRKGYRATWNNRAKLAVAKLARDIKPQTQPAEFAGILLSSRTGSGDDQFIEVNIWGAMTIRTFDSVLIRQSSKVSRARLSMLKEALQKHNITLEVRP